jgi:hypothetical protein
VRVALDEGAPLLATGDALQLEQYGSPANALYRIVGATGSRNETAITAAGVDHGALTGLADDDHTGYLLASGARTGASAQAQTFTNGIIGPSWKPAADSTTALQLQDAAGTAKITVDTTNGRLGIGITPLATLHVNGPAIIGGAGTENIFITGGNATITGQRNIAIGLYAGLYARSISGSVFIGYGSGQNSVSGSGNIAFGPYTLSAGVTAHSNVAIGYAALQSTVSGAYCIAIGRESLNVAKVGNYNTGIGYRALAQATETTTGRITAFADYGAIVPGTVLATSAGHGRTTGQTLFVLGSEFYDGIKTITVVDANTFYFSATWAGNFTYPFSAICIWSYGVFADSNTAIGYYAGYNITTGANNTFIGHRAGYTDGTATTTNVSNAMAIGYMAQVTANNTIVFGGTGAYSSNAGFGITAPTSKLHVVGHADTPQFTVTGHTTQAVGTGLVQFTRNDAAAGVSAMLTLTALGSGGAGDGGSLVMLGKSSTTAAQSMGRLAYLWNVATHASRSADLVAYVSDNGGEREGWRIRGTGTAAALGVFGVTPQARPAAYTQTYSTVTRIHSNPTAGALTDSSGGTPGATLAAITGGGSACEDATKNAVASLAAQINALITDIANVKQVINQVVDDMQGYGWLQ